MPNAKLKKEMLCGRGLIPTELAESKIDESHRQKCNLLRVLKLIMVLAISIVVVYFVCTFSRDTNTFIEIDKYHTESLSTFQKPEQKDIVVRQIYKRRNKRHAKFHTENIESNRDGTFHIKNMQKAREIVMNDDILCDPNNTQETCKNLVMKIKKVSHSDINNEKEMGETNLKRAHKLKELDQNIANHNMPENEFTEEFKHESPLQIADTCLLARLLKNNYPYVQGVLNIPVNEYTSHRHQHGNHHNHQQFSHQTRQNLHSEETISSLHHQDVEIRFGKFLTSKHPTEIKSNHAQARLAECPPDFLSCDNGEDCIPENQWCNGRVDCPDVSDEAQCTCKSRVDRTRICDGYFDCPFGEDEIGCNGCSDNSFSCDDEELMGSQATCFTKEQRCNNIIDCPNHKDEQDCNMLAPTLNQKPLFAVSNTEGFLHRNFKGNWYAVCKNPYMWAHDVCRKETGLIIRPPFIHLVQIDPLLKVHYLNTGEGGMLQTSDTCFNSSAVHVTCPDLLCGMRVLTSQQRLKENIEVENQLFGRNKRFLNRLSYPFYNHNQRFWRDQNNFDYRRNLDKVNTYSMMDINLKSDGRNKRAQSRVVGGKASQPASWPWMVALYRNGKFHCGGNILTQRWVISAAHCVSEYWQHYYEVQVGMLRRFSFSPQEHNIHVTHIISNQRYSKTDMKNDLSLLRVAKAIQFSRWVRPICLPGPETAGSDWLWGPPPGTMCTAVGWGATKEHGADPDHMREVEVPIWASCNHREDIDGNEICAGILEGGKDACQGDSGGPLLCRNPLNSQQWYIAGIVSHGDGCGRKGEPGVYTRVSLFVKWIRYHIFSRKLPSTQPKQECPGFKCISGIPKCLPNNRLCDKIVDCLNGEDELNCSFMRSADTEYTDFSQNSHVNVTNMRLTKEAENVDVTSFDFSTKPSTVSETSKYNANTLQSHDVTTVKNKMEVAESEQNLSETNESKEDVSTSSHFEIASSTIKSSTKGDVEMSNSNGILENFVSVDKNKGQNLTIENMRKVDMEEDFTDFISTSLTSTWFPETTTMMLPSESDISTVINSSTMEPKGITVESPDLNNANNNLLDDQIASNTKNNETTVDLKSLVIELLPNSMRTLNETTPHSVKKIENISLSSQFPSTTMMPIKTTKPEKLLNFDDKRDIMNKIEDMVLSELQPAKIRKKHLTPKEFICRRILQTISYDFRCDRKPDCEDGTDELDCSCVDYLASFDSKLICDGEFDCADGQDEMDCFSCIEEKFLCKRSKVCIPTKHVCDGQAQCPQGEDELDCLTLTNGKEILFDFDGRPRLNLEGYVTEKHENEWHIVCEENISIKQQEQAAGHICRYLGFSSAKHYIVKHINIKEESLKSSFRKRRSEKERKPITFSYRRVNEENETNTQITIKEPQVLREECVPNITKTCMSLYVFCDQLLFTDFDIQQQLIFDREAETVTGKISETTQNWPWVAKVFVEGSYKCSGILVDKSWVLVSHSCLWDVLFHRNFVSVVLGSYRTLDSVSSAYEQVYQVDAKKDLLRSSTTLLRLMGAVHYSTMVKPMVIVNSIQDSKPKMCLAHGQDENNTTISLFLEETFQKCDPHSKCYKRVSKESVCQPGMTTQRQWAGIISCHSDMGWYPAASFVVKSGECGIGQIIVGSEIINLRKEIKRIDESISSSVESSVGEECNGVRCGRGKCMGLRQVCDGIKDCENGNDESDDSCAMKHGLCKEDPYLKGCDCASDQLKCRNGKCVLKKLFSDGHDDCGDRSDEPDQTTCAHYLAKVKPSRLCDGVLHCHDRTDEDPSFCKCFAKRSFTCEKSNDDVDQCVALDVVCDGVKDCPNGEDETFCKALHAPDDKQHGVGEVIVRSHGIWHTKCYSTPNHTRSDLEAICRELGFLSGHAKLLDPITAKLTFHSHNNVILDQFSEILLNNKTSIRLRNTAAPMARAIYDPKIKDCYPVFIECL